MCIRDRYGNKCVKRKADGSKYKDFYYYGCKHRSMTRGHKCDYKKQDVYKRQVIHLALQFLVDGFPQLADVTVRLPTHSGKPGGAVQPQREKIQNFLMFLAQFLHHAGNKGISGQVVHLIGAVKQDVQKVRCV